MNLMNQLNASECSDLYDQLNAPRSLVNRILMNLMNQLNAPRSRYL